MRTALLAAALTSLVTVVPAVAQTTKKPPVPKAESRRSAPPQDFVAVLSGSYEVPPVETPAIGTVELRFSGSRVHYQVHVDSIGDVTGAYVHIGRAGEDQPAVADLFEGLQPGPVSGLLASGTLRAADLHGTTMSRLLRALRADDAYCTVHTRAHPGGELRGQLRVQPMVASQ